MDLKWIEQIDFTFSSKCRLCGKPIDKGTLYFRAYFNEDSLDEYGYDCHENCKEKVIGPPKPLESI